MKKAGKIRLVILTVLAAVTNYICGCSIVGYAAGRAIDNSIDDKKSLTNWECAKIKEGVETTVYLSDGRAVVGEFGGLDKKPADAYNMEYTDFRKTNGDEFYLPDIGDTLRIKDWKGDRGMHEFLGFDYVFKRFGRSYKKHTRALCTNVSASTLEGKKEKHYPIENLHLLENKNGNAVTGKDLEGLSSETTVPLRSRIAMKTNAGVEYLNFDDIGSMDVPRKKYGRWIGLGVGVAIDAAIITVLIILSSFEPVNLDNLRFGD